MWTTLLFPNRTMLSPSVCARGAWVTSSSSPLRRKLMSRVKVTTGSATFGSGLVFMPRNSMNPSVESRFLTFSCATMIAAALPRFSLPPVWSKCQWVFRTNLTGLEVRSAIAAWIVGVSGANWSSITNTACSPTETPRFPPEPVIIYTVSASFSVWISTLEKSGWADAAAAKSAAAQTANMRRKQVLTDVLLWLGWDLLLNVLRRHGDARIRRKHFKSTGSQRAHRPPVVRRVTASSRMNQLAYYIVMISLSPS